MIPLNRSLGKSGLNYSMGRVYEEWNIKLRQGGINGVSIYREMADTSPVIGALLRSIELMLGQAEIRFDPADESAEAKAVAEQVAASFEGMDRSWIDVLSEILTMLPYGWSLLETNYRQSTSGRWDWASMELRSQDSLWSWKFDEAQEVEAFIQRAQPNYTLAEIPAWKFLLFRTSAVKNNPEGRSILRNAFRPWWYAQLIEDSEANGIRRDLGGLPDFQVPSEYLSGSATTEQAQIVADLFEYAQTIYNGERAGIVRPAEDEARQNSDGNWVSVKTGFKFGLVASPGSRQHDTDKIITRHEKRILMSCLAEYLMVGLDDHGSFALADSKTSMFAIACNAIMRRITSVFDTFATPRLLGLNGIPKRLTPKMRHMDFETQDFDVFARGVTSLLTSGGLTPDAELEAYIRKVGGLPPMAAPELAAELAA